MRQAPGLLAATLLAAGSFLALPAAAADVEAGDLRIVHHVPLSELGLKPKTTAVDPLAVYSNITNINGQAFGQGPATGGISRLVMDDLTFTTDPAVGAVTNIRFSVANLNAISHSVRARIRFWNADGPSLGPGLPNAPGTYYAPGGTPVGFSFNPLTFPPGIITVAGNTPFTVPAGATTTLWAGITFDNMGTTTGATDTELSNFGQGFANPVDLGSSTNVVFETTAAGSFFPTDNPAGATLTFGTTTANQGWEITVATLPVELTGFSVD